MIEIANMTEQDLSVLGFRNAPAGIVVLANRRIVSANAEIEHIFGWSRIDLEGQSIRVLYPSSVDFEKVGTRWQRWLQKPDSYEDERFMQRRNGEIIWVRARGRTLTPEDPFQLTVWTLEHLQDRAPASAALTLRQREVARGMVNGYTSKEIGLAMGISPRTVEVHRRSIKQKLGVHKPAELAAKLLGPSTPEPFGEK